MTWVEAAFWASNLAIAIVVVLRVRKGPARDWMKEKGAAFGDAIFDSFLLGIVALLVGVGLLMAYIGGAIVTVENHFGGDGVCVEGHYDTYFIKGAPYQAYVCDRTAYPVKGDK